jgi:hypothetical protein
MLPSVNRLPNAAARRATVNGIPVPWIDGQGTHPDGQDLRKPDQRLRADERPLLGFARAYEDKQNTQNVSAKILMVTER